LWAKLAIAAGARHPGLAEKALNRARREAAALPAGAGRPEALAGYAIAAAERGDDAAARKALVRALRACGAIPREDRVTVYLGLAGQADQIGDRALAGQILVHAAGIARLIPEAHYVTTALIEVAEAACRIGPASLARALLDEVAHRPDIAGHGAAVKKLVIVAVKDGHQGQAADLLHAFAAAPPTGVPLTLDPRPPHARWVSLAAAGAGFWPVIEQALDPLEPRIRADVLGEMAGLARDEAPERARQWICQALQLAVTPYVLAATARLQPSLAVPAIGEFLARAHGDGET
jgi:hypothetical protein